MEFQNDNGTALKNGAATEVKNNVPQNGAAKTNGVEKATNGNGKGEVKDVKPTPAKEEPAKSIERPKAKEPKKEEPKAEVQQPKEEAKPQLEQPKEEIAPVKKELSLETKLKAVEDLHRKTIQRLSLITRMKQLEGFEVALVEEGDELENNPYQGCKLIIQDDKKREFVTMTPGLIRLVAQFIFDSCALKLEEIESTINFPVA